MTNATIKTLTPVHIGNGVSYNKGIDFIQKNNQVGIIDERKVLDMIGKEHVNQWVEAIEKYNHQTDFNKQPILELLKVRGFANVELEKISKRISKLIDVNNSSSQLKEQFRTSLVGVCIPGSSLKGSIKTAIYETLASYQEIKLSVNDIKKFNHRYNRNDYKDYNADNKLFGKNANEKTTRFLKIGDIHFNECETEVIEVKILNKQFNSWAFKQGQQLLLECIPENEATTFNFKIDEILLKKNLEYNQDLWPKERTEWLSKDLLEIVNDFTKRMLDWEISRLHDEELGASGNTMLVNLNKILNECEKCSKKEMVLRVGANCGWSFMTGEWFLLNEGFLNESELSEIRRLIQKRNYDNMDMWPKTRKISSTGQIFGFVKVAINE